MYPPSSYGQPYPQQPRRSAIPRVIGIIGIAFACVGLGASALFTIGPIEDIQRSHEDLGSITMWLYAWMLLSVLLFGLHLVGSILAIMYRPTGPKILTSYAVGAIILIVIDMVMCHGFVPKSHLHGLYGSVAISHTVFSAIAFPWPVVVLALINSKRSREACA